MAGSTRYETVIESSSSWIVRGTHEFAGWKGVYQVDNPEVTEYTVTFEVVKHISNIH